MIVYINENGENILHIAARYHLDKVIRLIMDKSLLVKNNNGKSPLDLYQDNNITNLLFNSIQLF